MVSLTPLQYVNKFKAIPLLSDRGHVENRVRLDTYLIYLKQDLPEKDRFNRALRRHLRKHGTLSFKVETVQGARTEVFIDTRESSYQHGVDAFYGKGSPEDIQYTLQAARLMGLVRPHAMQTWCNSHIGIDCSGFVGNYLWHVVLGKRWDLYGDGGGNQSIGPNTGIRSMCKRPYVTQLSEISNYPNDLFVLATCDRDGKVYARARKGSPAHVMITEPGAWRFKAGKKGPEPWKVVVCESVSGGPQASRYDFKDFKNGIFRFYRGNKNNKVIRVRIHRISMKPSMM